MTNEQWQTLIRPIVVVIFISALTLGILFTIGATGIADSIGNMPAPVTVTVTDVKVAHVEQTDPDEDDITDTTWAALDNGNEALVTPAIQVLDASGETWELVATGVLSMDSATPASVGAGTRFQCRTAATENDLASATWADVDPNSIGQDSSAAISRLYAGGSGALGTVDYSPTVYAAFIIEDGCSSAGDDEYVQFRVQHRLPDTAFLDITRRYGWVVTVKAYQERTLRVFS